MCGRLSHFVPGTSWLVDCISQEPRRRCIPLTVYQSGVSRGRQRVFKVGLGFCRCP